MQACINAHEPLIYDPPCPRLIKTFKLLLDKPDRPICGVLLFSISVMEFTYKFNLRSTYHLCTRYGSVGDLYSGVANSFSRDAVLCL